MRTNKNFVCIIDDDLVLGNLIKNRINKIPGFECNDVFPDPIEFLDSNTRPDIILLDVLMPRLNGVEAIDLILKKYPETAIIMNTIKDDTESIFEALRKGALGYLDKQSHDDSLAEVLNSVAGGGAYMAPSIALKVFKAFQRPKANLESLSPREKDVAQAILDGLTYLKIAIKYGISIDTVRMNVRNIYRKLNINSKSQLFKLTNN